MLRPRRGGFQNGELIIVGARTSAGKTSLGIDIVRMVVGTVSGPSGSAAVFTLEMPKEQIVDRLIAAEARVNVQRIRTGKLSDEDWHRMMGAADSLSAMSAGIHICDNPAISALQVRSLTRRLASKLASTKRPLRAVLVDYLQLMSACGREDRREEVIAANTRALKALAKELSIPVIALAQVNRDAEKRNNHRPQLSDLRESGSLEQDADVVLFIYRGESYGDKDVPAGEADIIVAKQRNGPVGTARVAFVHEYSSFRNLHSSSPTSAQMELAKVSRTQAPV